MNNNDSNFVSAILLAAGESTRMGEPKLLLPFGDGTVLSKTVDNVLSCNVDEVIVVLGANAEKTREALAGKPIKTVFNPDYSQGMSTSLICGLKQVSSQALRIMVALSDQPLIEKDTYNKLIKESITSSKGITVPLYKAKRGNPIIFAIGYKDEMLQLKGDVGGRELLQRHPKDVYEVAVDSGSIYINLNTMDAYNSALN